MSKANLKSAKRSHKTAAASAQNNRLTIGIVAIALLALVSVGAFTLLNRPAGQGDQVAALPKEISVQQAHEKYTQGVFLLDVRTQEEWDQTHVPGATLVPLDQLQNRLDELPRDQEIVVICRSGNRSATGRDMLLDAGFESVTSVAGGMNQWTSAGYPTEP